MPPAVGNGISSFGTGCEIVLDFLNGEFGDSFKDFMYYALEKTIDTGIDKIMPGNIGPSKKKLVNKS